jgi:hypothetical protein
VAISFAFTPSWAQESILALSSREMSLLLPTVTEIAENGEKKMRKLGATSVCSN